MFDNTLKLTRFILKREKVSSVAWLLSIVIFNALIILLFIFVMVPLPEERAQLMAMFENPALLAMVGPLHPEHGVSNIDMGYVFTLFMMVIVGVAVAIMNVFLIVRHTRTDEEAGRYEVLRSLPSGRLANINAAMVSAVIINTILAVFTAISMFLVFGLGDSGFSDFGSALLWGVNMGVIGLVFAAVAALFSQLSSNARGAMSYSFFVLGLFYLSRAVADMDMNAGSEGFALISPFGLISRTWVYVDNIWWPVLVVIGMAAVFTALAYWLCSTRDIDQGLIPARPGKSKGGMLMKSPFGLNLRLKRLSIIVWVIIMLSVAASYGTILEDIENFIGGSDMYRQLMLAPIPGLLESLEGAPPEEVAAVMNSLLEQQGYNVVQMFANMIGFIMAMVAAIPVLMFILKAKGEEVAIRAELIFATPASRTKYLSGLVIISFATAVLVQAAQAIGMFSLVQSIGMADRLPLKFLMESMLVYVPALWVMGGLATLLVGAFPKRTGWIWAYYGFAFFAMMYGRMLPDLEILANFTPMGWVPQLPVDDISWAAMIVLSVIGIALAALGISLYNKRDINAITH